MKADNSGSKFLYENFLIIVSSPSGAGKSTLCRLLIEKDDAIVLSVSATTREKRPNEIEGRDYYFVSSEKFENMVQNREFIEYADIFGCRYGTPKKMVEDALNSRQDVLFDIDWQGARQLRQNCKNVNIVSIFILPPSMQELARRLKRRAQDSEEVVKSRMAKAKDEISHFDEYDFLVVNQDLEEALSEIKAIVTSTRIQKRDKYKLISALNF